MESWVLLCFFCAVLGTELDKRNTFNTSALCPFSYQEKTLPAWRPLVVI